MNKLDMQRLEWLDAMLRARSFEDKVQELCLRGTIEGPAHMYQGQEAVAAGVTAAMRAKDQMTVTYRGHGGALARGTDPTAAFAELFGRIGGMAGGVGGSMHFTDPALGIMGSFAIVGAGMPFTVGLALSAKLQGTGACAVTFFGDGATNIGSFHEALNMAAVWKAPVLFVCENNLYGEYSPVASTTAGASIAGRAEAYGIPGVIVDGMDVAAVFDVADTALERARTGAGPTLLECRTYRYVGHSRHDPAKYRPAGELDAWKARDPIDTFAARLVADGVLTAATFAARRDAVNGVMQAAAQRALEQPHPTHAQASEYLYGETGAAP